MSNNEKKQPELLVDSHHGVYIPQVFCQSYQQYITNFQRPYPLLNQTSKQQLKYINYATIKVYGNLGRRAATKRPDQKRGFENCR